VFYFTCNQVWNWNKRVSLLNYFSNTEHVGEYSWADTISANHSVSHHQPVVSALLTMTLEEWTHPYAMLTTVSTHIHFLPLYATIAASINYQFFILKHTFAMKIHLIILRRYVMITQKYTQQLWLTASHAHPLKECVETSQPCFHVLT